MRLVYLRWLFSNRPAQSGKIAEYAILIALLGGLGIASLQVLGISIAKLPNSVAQALQTHSTLTVLGVTFALPQSEPTVAKQLAGQQGQYYKLNSASATGQPSLGLVETNSSPVNATSVDGNQFNSLGVYRLANYLDQLANTEQDPARKDYYAEMAELAYYMGANESELDDYKNIGLGRAYNNGDALNDLLVKQAKLEQMLKHPPVGMNADTVEKVQPVVHEVLNIAQGYRDKLSRVIGLDGKVARDFMLKDINSIDPAAATSGLGISFSQNTKMEIQTSEKVNSISYEEVVPYEQLKTHVASILASTPLTEEHAVLTDYRDAQHVESYTAKSR